MPQPHGKTSTFAPFLSAAIGALLFAVVPCFLVVTLAGQSAPPSRTAANEVPTAQEILERSLKASEQNWKLSENYTWRETRFFRQKDKQGKVKEQESKTYDVTMIDGKEYERLIMEDGEPLSPEKERKEQAKLDKEVAELQRENPSQRARRLAKQKEEREEQERMFRAVPKAFRFQLVGEETIDGRPAWLIAAAPRDGFKPFNRPTSWLPKMKGRLWIDKQSLIWLKAEVETLDTISFGLFLARVGKGSTMQFEQQLVNGEVWMPRRTEVAFDARLAIFKKLNGEAEILFSDYKKFSSDSKVVSTTVVDSTQE